MAGLETLADSYQYYSSVTKGMPSPLATLDVGQDKPASNAKKERSLLAGKLGDSVQVLPDAGTGIDTIQTTIVVDSQKAPAPQKKLQIEQAHSRLK